MMQLELDHIIPEPLKGRVGQQDSEVWNCRQTITPGETVFLRAPSGKGKSTFMHILYGLRGDYEGKAFWDGKEIGKLGDSQWAALRSRELSIVFQDLRLFGDLSVAENLEIKQSLTHTVTMDQARAWLQLLGLEGKWEQKAETLSYGERQRVAIVRCLLQPFQWLLLDEPFSHLDDENAGRAAKLIWQQVQVNKAGMLVVDLEHNDWFPYTRKMLL
ncbi:ATP-binding cassette domain-containing protein [Taibaiella chishuiensis]|uniref:Putative ABC transport system ATP-binding protein n=1 Tax=Taibaiella chishuiensis TaxID=1434707 RepID=A0A2P8CW87_9BACT|nr:ATP-binding cassette domain-containing protein [Taibaiella chishuiensis]PSK89228.1 putative ABC transport system ATP-binding protein [Taibaiella chishuiensis]